MKGAGLMGSVALNRRWGYEGGVATNRRRGY